MTLTARRETFDTLTEEWKALADACPAAYIFSTPAWQRAWWDSLRGSEELLLLAFRDGGETKGIAPLMRVGNVLRFICYSDVCDYHDFLCVPGVEQEFYGRLLDELMGLEWSALELDGLPEESPTLRMLPEMAAARGLKAEVAPDGVSPRVLIAGSWEEYQGSLDKKDRHELRRKLRRLGGAGHVALSSASDSRREDVAALLELLKNSREKKAAFLTPERERFFYDLAAAMSREGQLKLFFLELDRVRVAACFCFDYKGAYYLYNSGYDVQYASLSVGLLLKALCLKDAIEQGRSRFDLLRGSESYKYDLGGRDHRIHKLVLRR